MRPPVLALSFFFIASLSLVACSERSVDQSTGSGAIAEPEAPDAAQPMAIDWYAGSVESAFENAGREKKPVFLYWGAQWCPPCHELRATIFKRPEFVRQSRQFINVYLDGDSDRAQKYGEKFSVMGYPTVIIFAADGEEVTRIPGGMNIEQYVGVLDLALNAIRPVAALLDDALAGKPLQDADWKLLAYYSWSQDRGHALGEQSLTVVAPQLAAACPDRLVVEKSLLQMLAVEAWVQDETRDSRFAPAQLAVVEHILDDDTLAAQNRGSFLFSAGEMVQTLAEGDDRQRLAGLLHALQLSVINDPEADALLRVDALQGWLDVQRALAGEDQPLSAERETWLREQLRSLREQFSPYQVHAGINGIWQIYYGAGLQAEARAALEDGVKVSKQPYYFMADLGYLEAEEGNGEVALAWYRQAWEGAKGPATRQQWGVNYLQALVRFSPDAVATIGSTGQALLTELAEQADGLHQRTARGVERMSNLLLAWAEEQPADASRQQVISSLRQQMDRFCTGLQGVAPEACASFLVSAPAQA